MIRKIFRQVRADELAGLAHEIIQLYKSGNLIGVDYMVKLFTRLESEYLKLNGAINKAIIFSDLGELDSIRDKAYRSFVTVVRGYSSMPDPGYQNAAKLLLEVLDNYPFSLLQLTYHAQSGRFNALIEDLKVAPLPASMSALPLVSESYAAFQQAQSNFLNAQIVYDQYKGQLLSSTTATAYRKDLYHTMNKNMVDLLRVMLDIDTDTIRDFAKSVDQMIERVNMAISARLKKDADEDTTEEDD